MNLQWITPVSAIPCPRLWKDFSAQDVVSATLTITGLGLYRAEINGQRVGQDYLTPGYNDYDAYVRYQTYDVTALLQAENHLEVTLGKGWYSGRFSKGNIWGDQYFLAARLDMTHADGSASTLVTDESWFAAPSVYTNNSIYDGEYRDDTRDTSAAVPCKKADVHYNLVEPISPAIRCKMELKPTLLITPKGEQVLDFHQNMAGTFRFVNRAPKGQTVHIQAGELLQEDCFYRENLRSAKAEFVYVSDGQVKDVEPTFTFYGFRYLKVQGMDVNPDEFAALVLYTDLQDVLEVETGHGLLNQLMKNSLWGQRSNFVDVPTDCPQRDERLGWTGDTQAYCATACYQMSCKAFYDKFMADMRADQLMYFHGNLPSVSPSNKGKTRPGGAAWADAGTIVPWTVYQHYGDLDMLRRHYPVMRDYVDKLHELDIKDGGSHLKFSAFTYGDWLALDCLCPQTRFGGTPNAYIQAHYYYLSTHLTALAAAELSEAADAARFAALAEEIRSAMMDEYVTLGGHLSVETQTGYILALRHGLYRNKQVMIEDFRRRLHYDHYQIKCGFVGAPLILPVLFDCGMDDVAYRMLLNEKYPSWLSPIKQGATTIWERWNALDEEGRITGISMNSFNHYAYGAVCEGVYTHVMGLQCAAPGWTKARIAPHPDGRLRHASIRHQSIAGTWAVSWRISPDNTLTLTAEIPAGASAEIVLPTHPADAVLQLGPGKYTFTYMPTRDYVHPFDEYTLLMDVLNHPEGKAVIDEFMPNGWPAPDVPNELPLRKLDSYDHDGNPGIIRYPEEKRQAMIARFKQIAIID